MMPSRDDLNFRQLRFLSLPFEFWADPYFAKRQRESRKLSMNLKICDRGRRCADDKYDIWEIL